MLHSLCFHVSLSHSSVTSSISRTLSFSCPLVTSATANNEDTIILSPPTTLTVQEGEAVTVPCVATGTQQPVFMFGGSDLPMGAQSNQYSLDFAAIAPESSGSYSCQVESITSTFSINVLSRLTVAPHDACPPFFPTPPFLLVTPLLARMGILIIISSGRSSSHAHFVKSFYFCSNPHAAMKQL